MNISSKVLARLDNTFKKCKNFFGERLAKKG